MHKGKHRESSANGKTRDRRSGMAPEIERQQSSSTTSQKSGRSQLVDLVVEDVEAEETERVRARKEGGGEWNTQEQKHFVRTYGDGDVEEGEDIREGFEPNKLPATDQSEFAIGDDEEEEEEEQRVDQADRSPDYGTLGDERNPWD